MMQVTNKDKWPNGPWKTEPDELDLQAAGLNIHLHRHPDWGHWCGYVEVPETSFLFCRDYGKEHIPEFILHWERRKRMKVSREDLGLGILLAIALGVPKLSMELVLGVHGGVTYSGPSYWTTPEKGWWVGFDCGHCSDFQPGFTSYDDSIHYRDLTYAKDQAVRLASDIALAQQTWDTAGRGRKAYWTRRYAWIVRRREKRDRAGAT